MSNKTYYEILDIPQKASSDEIKKAYYSLCKIYHPDINPKTADKFKEINEAYENLIDPYKRKEYDRKLNEPEDTEYEYTEDNEYTYYRSYNILIRMK